MRIVQMAALAGLMSIFAATSSTQAAMIPLLSGLPTANGANFNWTYDVTIGPDIRVKTGDFFTIYDFGAVLGHTQPAGWTFTSTLLGTTPVLILPTDDPTLSNVTFTYTGLSPIVGSADLGNFVLTIPSNSLNAQMPYGAQATRNGGTQDGRFASDYGTLVGPADVSGAPPFPEPTSLAACGLAGLALLRRPRQKA